MLSTRFAVAAPIDLNRDFESHTLILNLTKMSSGAHTLLLSVSVLYSKYGVGGQFPPPPTGTKFLHPVLEMIVCT